MKKSLLLLVIILIASCNTKTAEVKKVEAPIAVVSKVEIIEKPFANPYIIYGSSFGEYFQVLYRQGDFDQMLKFTHSSSIKKHGEKAILARYEKMKFNFNIDLASSKKLEDNVFLLNYTSNVIATRNILRIKVSIENDSAKVILPDKLSEFPG